MPAERTDCSPLSQVLRKEFESVRPSELGPILAGPSSAITENDRRRELYRLALGELRLSALALSGGGIRSACVALGVIQSLAEAELLRQFDYLSTVSGGGYIGSWLSAWLYWNKKTGTTAEERSADNVIKALTSRSSNPDEEPPPIRHLRAYSSYLTPKLGLTSADTWAAVTQVVRNLVLNWLILVPAIGLVVLAVKIVAGLLHTAVLVSSPIPTVVAVVLVLAFAGWSLGYKLLRLYGTASAGSDANAKKEQSRFLRLSVLPALAAGICFAWLANKRFAPAGVVPRSWPGPASWPAPLQARRLGRSRRPRPRRGRWCPPGCRTGPLELVCCFRLDSRRIARRRSDLARDLLARRCLAGAARRGSCRRRFRLSWPASVLPDAFSWPGSICWAGALPPRSPEQRPGSAFICMGCSVRQLRCASSRRAPNWSWSSSECRGCSCRCCWASSPTSWREATARRGISSANGWRAPAAGLSSRRSPGSLYQGSSCSGHT